MIVKQTNMMLAMHLHIICLLRLFISDLKDFTCYSTRELINANYSFKDMYS